MKKKIAIFGGAFNPITTGHEYIADYVANNTDVSEVWVTPCFKHIYDKKMLNPLIRLKMCEISCHGKKNVLVSDFEIRNEFEGSTYIMICSLIKEFPDYDFSVVIGIDNVDAISRWYKFDELVKKVRFIILPRKGYSSSAFWSEWYLAHPHIYLPEADVPDTESTKVRNYIYENNLEDARKLLNKNVYDHIIDNKYFFKQ